MSTLGGRPRGRFIGFGMDGFLLATVFGFDPVVEGIALVNVVSFKLDSICIAAMDNLGLRNDRRLDGLALSLSFALVPGNDLVWSILPRRERRTEDALSSLLAQLTQYHGWFGAGTCFNGGCKQKI